MGLYPCGTEAQCVESKVEVSHRTEACRRCPTQFLVGCRHIVPSKERERFTKMVINAQAGGIQNQWIGECISSLRQPIALIGAIREWIGSEERPYRGWSGLPCRERGDITLARGR